jgi:hypothetical protein
MNPITFVSAQPDVPYFHWQIKLYVHNFIENNVDPKNITVLLGMNEDQPSDEGVDLLKLGINVVFIKDEREVKNYIPSIKPYLISKWLEKFPNMGKIFFLHDSDIIWNHIPNFSDLMEDDNTYLSDTKSYIGYNYLKDCSKKYEKSFDNCLTEQIIDEMCNVVGISKNVIIENQENSGGGQYIIKNTDQEFWKKVYNDSNGLYNSLIRFQRKFPIKNGKIQFWTAEMWSLLWNLWLSNKKTKISNLLDFSWATDNVEIYEKKPILHMAGVTEGMKNSKFFKGEFIDKDPIELLEKNINQFDYVDSNSSTIKYIDNMKSYVQKRQKRLFI